MADPIDAVEFRVLGALQACVGERPVALGTRRQRALVALLLVEANRIIAADRLIDLLWAGEPSGQALASLQSYVSNLRRALEPDRAPRQPATLLVTEPPGYRLAVGPDRIDAGRFEAALAQGRQLMDTDPERADAVLAGGLALWTGPAFAEFATEPFALAAATRLEELRLAALEDRFEIALRLGRHAVASADLERHVVDHPLRERPHALLALARYREGRQADALRVLDAIGRRLRHDLGLEPGPELRLLEQRILDQDPGLDASSLAPVATPTAEPVAVPPLRTPVAPSGLVGRSQLRDDLRATLQRAVDGLGGILLLEGEPGIGKTRLAEELGTFGRELGGMSAWGRCQGGDASPPFWPALQLVRQVIGALAPADRAALPASVSPLAELVPDLVPPDPDQPGPIDGQLARLRVFEAFTAVLVRPLPGGPPVSVLVIDDFHLADPSTVQLVLALAAEVATAPVVITCTLRRSEAAAVASIRDALTALGRLAWTRRVVLGPLGDDEISELVRREITVSDDVADVVVRRSGGNPFFATELARLLQAEHATDHVELASRAVPDAVIDVIVRRVARLPTGAQRFLTVAAVVGTSFNVVDVAATAGIDADHAFDLLEVALAAGLVVDERADQWRFAHALVADALLSEISPARRARWHAQHAATLVERHGDEPAAWAEIAHHVVAAGSAAPPGDALHWLLRAGDHAVDELAFEQAEELYQRLIDLAGAPGPGGQLAESIGLARLTHVRGWKAGYDDEVAHRFVAAAAAWDTATAEPSALLAEVLWIAGSTHAHRGELDGVERMAERLQMLQARSDDPTIAYLADDMAMVARWIGGRFTEMLQFLRPGPRPGVVLNPTFVYTPEIRIPTSRAMALWHLGEPDASLEELRTAQRAAVATRRGRADPGFSRRWSLLRTMVAGDVAETAAVLTGPLSEHSDEPYRYTAGIDGFAAGWVLYHEGRRDEGRAKMKAALETLHAISLRSPYATLRGLLAAATVEEDDPAELLTFVDETIDGARRCERTWLAELHRIRSRVLERLGRLDEARDAWQTGRDLAIEQGSVALLARFG